MSIGQTLTSDSAVFTPFHGSGASGAWNRWARAYWIPL